MIARRRIAVALVLAAVGSVVAWFVLRGVDVEAPVAQAAATPEAEAPSPEPAQKPALRGRVLLLEVVDDAGRAIAGAQVAVSRSGPSSPQERVAETDAAGFVAIDALDDVFSVQVQSRGHEAATVDVATLPREAPEVATTAVLKRTAEPRVRVVQNDEGVGGARVLGLDAEGRLYTVGTTGDDGLLLVDDEERPKIVRGACAVHPARGVGCVDAGADGVRDLTVVLPPVGLLRAVVQDARGQPLVVENVNVRAFFGGDDDTGADSAEPLNLLRRTLRPIAVQGEIEMPAGPVRVEATAPGFQPTAVTVDVPSGAAVTARLVLRPASRLRGVVVDAESGAAIAGADVSLEGTGYDQEGAQSDGSGRFVLDSLPDRKVGVAVEARGYRRRVTGVDGGRATDAELRVELSKDTGGEGQMDVDGIGVGITMRDGAPSVWMVVEGGPAARAGVAEGDVIARVDGRAVNANEALGLIRGPAGTSVELTLRDPGGTERVVTVPRERVAAPAPRRRGR